MHLECLSQGYWLMGVYGTSKLPKLTVTSNVIYIVAFCSGFKCPRKIHLNTQCPLPPKSANNLKN